MIVFVHTVNGVLNSRPDRFVVVCFSLKFFEKHGLSSSINWLYCVAKKEKNRRMAIAIILEK